MPQISFPPIGIFFSTTSSNTEPQINSFFWAQPPPEQADLGLPAPSHLLRKWGEGANIPVRSLKGTGRLSGQDSNIPSLTAAKGPAPPFAAVSEGLPGRRGAAQILCRADWAGQDCSGPTPRWADAAVPLRRAPHPSRALPSFAPTPTTPPRSLGSFRTGSVLSVLQSSSESRLSRRQPGHFPHARARLLRGRARPPIKAAVRARRRHYPLRSERREAGAAAVHLFPQQPTARRPTPLTPRSR